MNGHSAVFEARPARVGKHPARPPAPVPLASRASQPAPAFRPRPNWLVRSWRRWVFCSRRARERRELRHADAETIRDLGPSRVSHEIESPFWRG